MIDLSDLILNNDSRSRQNSSLVNGILLGVVKSNWNEDLPGQVEVEMYYGPKGKTKTEWIKVMQSYAGKEFGQYFLPEIGAEVVVSYVLGDVSSPIVIGCLWNTENTLPKEAANKDNTIKKIITKGGHELIFDDKAGEEQIIISTKGKLNITIADKAGTISIQDEKKKNGLVIDSKKGSIELTADKKIVLKAGSESIELAGSSAVTVKGSKINLKAVQDAAIEGVNVKINGKATAELKSSATVKVEGGAMAEIKGGLVKIN